MGKFEQNDLGPVRIDSILKEFGFNPDAPESTARALVLNLIRSAYGAEAAKDAFLRMNLKTTQSVISDPARVQIQPGQQLSFFDSELDEPNSA